MMAIEDKVGSDHIRLDMKKLGLGGLKYEMDDLRSRYAHEMHPNSSFTCTTAQIYSGLKFIVEVLGDSIHNNKKALDMYNSDMEQLRAYLLLFKTNPEFREKELRPEGFFREKRIESKDYTHMLESMLAYQNTQQP